MSVSLCSLSHTNQREQPGIGAAGPGKYEAAAEMDRQALGEDIGQGAPVHAHEREQPCVGGVGQGEARGYRGGEPTRAGQEGECTGK
jgi:hypothetical protein